MATVVRRPTTESGRLPPLSGQQKPADDHCDKRQSEDANDLPAGRQAASEEGTHNIDQKVHSAIMSLPTKVRNWGGCSRPLRLSLSRDRTAEFGCLAAVVPFTFPKHSRPSDQRDAGERDAAKPTHNGMMVDLSDEQKTERPRHYQHTSDPQPTLAAGWPI